MKYIETLPSKKFSDLILNYWLFEIPKINLNTKPFIHDIMPENNVSIVFINQPYYKGLRLLGPQTTKYQQQIFLASTYLGIRFYPWVKMESIIEKKDLILNQRSNSPDFLKNIFKEIDVDILNQGFTDYELLEKGLLRLVENKKILIDPLTKYICLELIKGKRINKIIKDIPLSIRPIQKKFKSTTGITMSDFRTINGLQNTVRMIFNNNESITTAAFKNDYADHAHFLNTFKRYMKTSVNTFIQKAKKIEFQV